MEGPRDTVLAVRGASRKFGERSALRGIDLSIGPGQIFALIGSNGAGKTSLVRAISGRLALDSGTVHVLGHDTFRDPAARRLIGLVPQAIALYSHLTARENLEVFGRLSGLDAGRLPAAVDEALDWASLRERANERTATLSGGMQRRLNIAAGALHRPPLLLLDEPTVGIDVLAREGIHELMRELRRTGVSILLTTHDLDQAAELADSVGLLAEGRLLAEGTPARLVQEVFGETKELIVTLAGEPDERVCELLEQEGLRPAKARRSWTGASPHGFDHASQVSRRLAELGLSVDEVRVREPGLRGVFLRLAGQEIGA